LGAVDERTMPQEFLVVQCCTCKIFQVQLLKKQPKFACSCCGEKQSVQGVSHRGAAKACRQVVVAQNAARIEAEQQAEEQAQRETEWGDVPDDAELAGPKAAGGSGRWDAFIE
jgi:hypothetical protein